MCFLHLRLHFFLRFYKMLCLLGADFQQILFPSQPRGPGMEMHWRGESICHQAIALLPPPLQLKCSRTSASGSDS